MQNEMGMNYEKINTLCSACDSNSMNIYDSISVIREQMREVIESGFWVGADAEAFKLSMEDRLNKIYSTTKWINHITSELKKHAEKLREQEHARAEHISSRMDY